MIDRAADKIVVAAAQGDTDACQGLAKRLAQDPLQQALFPQAPDAFQQRLALFDTLSPGYRQTMQRAGVADPSPGFLFNMVVPLCLHLSGIMARRTAPMLIGIGGGPGAGKSTLSRVLANSLQVMAEHPITCLSLSLDDFYFSKQERLRRGFKWRTLPGTHDTERLAQFVQALDAQGASMAVPRYDLARDCPGPDDRLARPPDICVFDGAMVGSRLPGYDVLAQRIDVLIYLDAPVALLKHWRFARERAFREASGGTAGFSPEDMRAFWKEALKPSIHKWVMPNAAHADLVIGLGPGRMIESARTKSGEHSDTGTIQ